MMENKNYIMMRNSFLVLGAHCANVDTAVHQNFNKDHCEVCGYFPQSSPPSSENNFYPKQSQ